MVTKSRGIGRGGKRAGSGRPKGAQWDGPPLPEGTLKRQGGRSILAAQLERARRHYMRKFRITKDEKYFDRAVHLGLQLLPYEKPRLSAQEIKAEVSIAPTCIRAPELIDDNQAWLEKYRPAQIEHKPPTEIEAAIVAKVEADNVETERQYRRDPLPDQPDPNEPPALGQITERQIELLKKMN
jgi:hypothetical protein